MKFLSPEVAVKLKEKGFNEPCWAWFNIPDQDIRFCYSEERMPMTNSDEDWNAKQKGIEVENIGLPTHQQVVDWFREKHNIRIVDSLHPHTMSSNNLNKDFHFHAIEIKCGEDGGGSGTKDLKFGNGNSEYKIYDDYYQALELTIHELLLKKI